MHIAPLLCIALFAHSANASDVVQVPLAEIHPTQMSAGWAGAREIEAKLLAVAKSGAIPISQAIANDARKKPLPAVRGPGGKYYITDGHHRALAVELAVRDGLIGDNDVTLALNVTEDDSQLDWDAFVARLKQEDIGFFTPSVRSSINSGVLSLSSAYRKYLPTRLQDVADDPLRSAMGDVFFQDGIHGGAFVNYIEFYTEEKIADRIKFVPGHETDEATLLQVRLVLWCDPAMISYLKGQYRDSAEKASGMIDSAVGAFLKNCH